MANVLLLDDNEVAGLAMRGIAARSRNRCAVASSPDEAWQLLLDLAVIDLVILEPRLQNGDGAAFLTRLRADPTFKSIPVVVYTSVEDHALAGRFRAFALQNYLIKPYDEHALHLQFAQAETAAWRRLLFEEERSFCAQLGLTQDQLRQMRLELMRDTETAAAAVATAIANNDGTSLSATFTTLQETAQAAGYWGLSDHLDEALAQVRRQDLGAVADSLPKLQCLARFIWGHLNPDHVPERLVSDAERREKEEEQDRIRWQTADVDSQGVVVPADSAFAAVDALPACPVIDTIGAEFRMATQAKSPTLRHVLDLVRKDPALSMQVLVAANSLDRDDPGPIEDPDVAVALLGNVRLNAMASNLPPVEERHMDLPPITWSQFWLFQTAVARLSLYCCQQLEFEVIQGFAHTAGLLHDIGKLLLVRLYPYGFRAMVDYARKHAVPLHDAERKYMGCTSRELALRFCNTHRVPTRYAHVIQWVENPLEAAEDTDLTAVVSLARILCLHNHVGYCGDTPKDSCPPIEETHAWQVLQARVYPSFNLKRFERLVHDHALHVKQELLGRTALH